MGPTLAVAFGAGLAGALLFGSLASGAPLAIILFYFAGLPLLIAGLGWGPYAGAFAGAIGALALSIAIRPSMGMFFFLAVALPAWILAHLSVTPRRTPDGYAAPTSVGLVLMATGGMAVALAVFAIVSLFGFDYEAYRATLGQMVERTLEATGGRTAGVDLTRVAPFLTAALPIVAAIVWTSVTMLNLYLAARVVRASGRLPVPWPDIATVRLPQVAAAALLVGSLGSFVGGFAGHVASILLAVGLVVFALAGLALIHDLTRGWTLRPGALGLLYALVMLLGWPLVFVALAGLADSLFDLRARRGSAPPPST